MIVKELNYYAAEITCRLIELKNTGCLDSDEYAFLRRKKAALRELHDYVLSGNWTRKASREKYNALVESGFDYKLIAERFNTTRESLDVFAARQNKRLSAVIGEAFRLIEQDRIEEGLESFYSLSGVFSPQEFDYKPLELLPKYPQRDSFLVSDCSEEVGILRSLMKSEMKKRLNGADSEKLSYLVFLLNSEDSAFAEQRAELIGLLRKKDSLI